jgi:hypothetical protein
MRHIDTNFIAKQFVYGLLLQVVVDSIQIAIAVGNYVHAVMVAHDVAPK